MKKQRRERPLWDNPSCRTAFPAPFHLPHFSLCHISFSQESGEMDTQRNQRAPCARWQCMDRQTLMDSRCASQMSLRCGGLRGKSTEPRPLMHTAMHHHSDYKHHELQQPPCQLAPPFTLTTVKSEFQGGNCEGRPTYCSEDLVCVTHDHLLSLTSAAAVENSSEGEQARAGGTRWQQHPGMFLPSSSSGTGREQACKGAAIAALSHFPSRPARSCGTSRVRQTLIHLNGTGATLLFKSSP